MEKTIFVVILRYLAGNEKIDAVRPAHKEFLNNYYADGTFFASGRQTSKNGGIILAHGVDRSTLVQILQRDPFYQQQLAEFQIFEFTPHNFSKTFGKFMELLYFFLLVPF